MSSGNGFHPPKPPPRRLKVVYIDVNTVMWLMQRFEHTPDFVSIPKVVMPEGTRVVSVYNDPLRACFGFLLENDDWPETPEGAEAEPYGKITVESVRLRKTTLEKEGLEDLLEGAWGLIANAGFGNWKKESKDWQVAAGKWCEDYHATKT